MAQYGPKSQAKVEEKMHELKHGQLRSGSGQKVTNPKQAIAIALSEARHEGGKVPPEGKPAAKKAVGSRSAKPKAADAGPAGKSAAKTTTKTTTKTTAKKKAPARKSSGAR